MEDLEQRFSSRSHSLSRNDTIEEEAEDAGFGGLDELEAPSPDENPDERQWYYRANLEERRSRSQERPQTSGETKNDELLVRVYTYGWLIFFSILGTLARLGTQWITNYPNAPVTINESWANVGGCFVLGFFQQDRAMFARERRQSLTVPPKPSSSSVSSNANQSKDKDELAKLRAELERRQAGAGHLNEKKAMPLYIGLTVGFCGSYTSFSSFIRDAFLALSNDLPTKNLGNGARSVGWSACAVLSVLIVEIGVSMTGLSAGAHFSELIAPLLFRIPKMNTGRFLNPLGVALAFGCWLGALCLAVWPIQNKWRQDCVFALVLAPVGCVLRFLLATKLNGRIAKFPLGTFAANVFGSLVLAVAYDLQRVSLPLAEGQVGGGLVSCQVLQGVIDGFCGTLTTVSTWIAELKGFRKHHAYVYGVEALL